MKEAPGGEEPCWTHLTLELVAYRIVSTSLCIVLKHTVSVRTLVQGLPEALFAFWKKSPKFRVVSQL